MTQNESTKVTHVQQLATLRRRTTKQLIQNAITYLKQSNRPITVSEIVSVTGLSKATVYRYREIIGKDNLRNYTKFSDSIKIDD
jgi:DNA invertase Pin-like site-specific DNA recombinase